MSLITKTFKPKTLLLSARALNIASTKQCHWFPDYKPGPYPKTKEEREAAAKKYNLLPEEYEPYPDDGFGAGDYPKLPYESVDSKDHNEIYDFPFLRRNYMEAVPKDQIILLPEMLSTGKRKYTYNQEFIWCLSILSGIALTVYLAGKVKFAVPFMEVQRPTNGVVHYTFELDYEGKYRHSAPVKQVRAQEPPKPKVQEEVKVEKTEIVESENVKNERCK